MKITTSQKIFIPILSILVAFSILAFQHIENSAEPIQFAPQENPVVIELFTSQSCSTCPNADIVANTIKDYENVIVLSYHVDYWNRLGWRDTFSDSRNTDYQRRYEKVMDRNSYTPQMIVNGKTEFDGSNIRLLNNSLKKKSSIEQLIVPEITRSTSSISISYDLFTEKEYSKAYALLIMDSYDVDIYEGPNKGTNMTNSNIVLEKVPLKLDNSQGTYTFDLSVNAKESDKFKVAILLQDDLMRVVGASLSIVK